MSERTQPPAPRGRRRKPRTQGFAVGGDGTPLYYRVSGHTGGERAPVLLCDGIGCDGYVWKYLEPELGRDRAVIHWHYRGHGKSPLPRDPNRITIADSADDLVAVLEAASDNVADWEAHYGAGPPDGDDSDGDEGARGDAFGKTVLLGHSMGVQVCLEAYRRHPSRVAGLVLICGAYGTPLRTFRGSRLLEDILPTLRLAVHAMPRAIGAFWKAALPTELAYKLATLFEVNGALIEPNDFFPYLKHMANVDVRLFVDMLAAAGRHTARELLPSVDVPTLILAADQDGFTPISLSNEMHECIRGSRLHVVKGGSHTAPIEKPNEVTEVIASFVRGLA